ncbi:MAG: BREX-1 system adenine-specific DNA-methyltransferase PglX [Desulfuromusa sp.]|nr:BREX-1 system adenine-specific DNA-methyltransferase PglX [Desulfuromusa sp.]
MTENKNFHRASATDFKKIPGSPIAYWVSARVRDIFCKNKLLGEMSTPRQGMSTSANDRFLRQWYEVSFVNIGLCCSSREESILSKKKWFPYNKGGSYRKWYGNQDYVVNWENDGGELREWANYLNRVGTSMGRLVSKEFYFKSSLSWSKVTAGGLAVRYYPKGFIFDVSGCSIFFKDTEIRELILNFFNSKLKVPLFSSMSPTINYEVGQISKTPINLNYDNDAKNRISKIFSLAIDSAKSDWDSSEISWDFLGITLNHLSYRQPKLKATYQKLRTHWQEMTLEMQRLEEENNLIFIKAYGLQDELTPEVPLKEITLTCNPHYRYGGNKNEDELETLLLADTMKEFISYAVGCMFGRYSLDKPGLILANQSETIEDYLNQIPEPTFMADDDNVIPILDDNWFTDDIAERFQRFLRVTFGDEHYETNLKFIEKAIGKNIRKYFLKDFYTDHVKRYKKRPIYWLFSSPKGNFNALIYMHRYRSDTVSVILNDYLREFRTKLIARKEHLEKVSISATADNREKTTALKEIEKLTKIIDELNAYENDTLYPLAIQNIEIDLDDGVKTNYPKFGNALKKIPGLS